MPTPATMSEEVLNDFPYSEESNLDDDYELEDVESVISYNSGLDCQDCDDANDILTVHQTIEDEKARLRSTETKTPLVIIAICLAWIGMYLDILRGLYTSGGEKMQIEIRKGLQTLMGCSGGLFRDEIMSLSGEENKILREEYTTLRKKFEMLQQNCRQDVNGLKVLREIEKERSDTTHVEGIHSVRQQVGERLESLEREKNAKIEQMKTEWKTYINKLHLEYDNMEEECLSSCLKWGENLFEVCHSLRKGTKFRIDGLTEQMRAIALEKFNMEVALDEVKNDLRRATQDSEQQKSELQNASKTIETLKSQAEALQKKDAGRTGDSNKSKGKEPATSEWERRHLAHAREIQKLKSENERLAETIRNQIAAVDQYQKVHETARKDNDLLQLKLKEISQHKELLVKQLRSAVESNTKTQGRLQVELFQLRVQREDARRELQEKAECRQIEINRLRYERDDFRRKFRESIEKCGCDTKIPELAASRDYYIMQGERTRRAYEAYKQKVARQVEEALKVCERSTVSTVKPSRQETVETLLGEI
ncbi:hypothetical protein EG329_010232 [Mollisiaceae sp. DMI_Dod_QoI]|nr:hypothetical protein EG329_010232 [Helotiales sp. DMI_Dod_QoI]